MERLSEMEALSLFLDTVGRDVLSIPNLEAIVYSVAKECACFPLGVLTIVGSLKDHAIERRVLIEYLIVEEIVKRRNSQPAMERGQAMLNKLACLLIGRYKWRCEDA
ncbi:hypothetical protein L484_007928 [Morus notabilis]|uniref:Uncharacterized protein n=1 Tax=Morus notabilis TaxID=981085 RepID=W9R0H0_9ROSA|nr:hypothetical protein L484_007928 [Morus notabilis]